MTASSAEEAAADLAAALGTVKRGTLRMFGDWFGRPMDNIHTARSATARGVDLVIRFDGGEELIVSDPGEWEFSPDVFRIGVASRVVWRWHFYGRSKVPENLFTIEHWVDAHGEVHGTSDVNWYDPVFDPSADEAAAELL
jgi:hypothetical protein